MKLKKYLSKVPQVITKRLPKAGPGPVMVVRLSGAIGAGGPLNRGLSLETVAAQLEQAFANKKASAVALLINSPGGSPVQSSLIGKRIRALATETELPVYAFVEDVAASGGYWLACAADEIYVDESSIVGSIGVVAAGFGFVDSLKKLGAERRVFTAGENKVRLDPFQKQKAEDVTWVKDLQSDIHETFRAHVRTRRAGKLKADEQTLMNGDVWIGQAAVETGLVDGIGDVRSFMRARFGEKAKLKVVQGKGGLAKRFGFKSSLADELIASADAALSEKLARARFGL